MMSLSQIATYFAQPGRALSRSKLYYLGIYHDWAIVVGTDYARHMSEEVEVFGACTGNLLASGAKPYAVGTTAGGRSSMSTLLRA
jgi:hypothetical protein